MNKLQVGQERVGQYSSYSKALAERRRAERETGIVHFAVPAVCYRDMTPLECYTLILGHYPASTRTELALLAVRLKNQLRKARLAGTK